MRTGLFSKIKNTWDYREKEFPLYPVLEWENSNLFS